MPRHATQTSFVPGQRRSPESIRKQRETIQRRIQEGSWKVNRTEWTEDQRARHAQTKRTKAIGHRYRHEAYWQVMTLAGPRYEHRVVMEELLGRPLGPDEHVHHRNGNTLDNSPENLEVLSNSDHQRFHAPGHLRPDAGKLPPGKWARHYDRCVECGRDSLPHRAKGLCSTCYARKYRV